MDVRRPAIHTGQDGGWTVVAVEVVRSGGRRELWELLMGLMEGQKEKKGKRVKKKARFQTLATGEMVVLPTTEVVGVGSIRFVWITHLFFLLFIIKSLH